jgi:hypothetical protein
MSSRDTRRGDAIRKCINMRLRVFVLTVQYLGRYCLQSGLPRITRGPHRRKTPSSLSRSRQLGRPVSFGMPKYKARRFISRLSKAAREFQVLQSKLCGVRRDSIELLRTSCRLEATHGILTCGKKRLRHYLMLCSAHTTPPSPWKLTSHKGGFYCVLGRDAGAADPLLVQPHSSATASKPPPVKFVDSGRTEMTIFLGL